jgi:hypothetical protein
MSDGSHADYNGYSNANGEGQQRDEIARTTARTCAHQWTSIPSFA